MKKAYYYRAQVSYPRVTTEHFKAYSKKDIKKWAMENMRGPQDLFIDDPYSEPLEGIRYIDLTEKTEGK